MLTNYLSCFPDWLSISYPTSLSPHLDLVSYFSSLSPLEYTDKGASKHLYKSLTGGTLFVVSKDDYVSVSISGSLLRLCRESGSNSELLQLLASAPYNITRLDVAYDVPIAGHIVINSIEKIYPMGIAVVSNRARQLQYILTQENKNQKSGTVYFQNNKYKGTIKLKVYDKALEAYQKRNDIIPSTTRYELSVCRGASLKDFSNPTDVFWHFIPKDLLKPSEGLKLNDWKAIERINYDDYQTDSVTDYQRLKFLIENHPVFRELIIEAKRVKGGDILLKNQIEKMFSPDAFRHVESETSVTSLIAN